MRPVERELRVDGNPVPVGARAFDVLLVLVVTKNELLDRVWPGKALH